MVVSEKTAQQLTPRRPGHELKFKFMSRNTESQCPLCYTSLTCADLLVGCAPAHFRPLFWVCRQAAIFRRETIRPKAAFTRPRGVGDMFVTSTIALVDDDRNILTSVSMALEAEGFAVRCYSDGAEALQGMTAQPVDLAVLDIKMPRMDGMKLLDQLRKQKSHIP